MIEQKRLAGKNVLLGVTGGIAAYKALDLISQLKKSQANIKVVLTENATEFVNPLSFEVLTENPVYVKMFNSARPWDIDHINLAKWADIIVVVPATANILGKINHGIADDLLTTTIMAASSKVLFAPAMNTQMFMNPIVENNISSLSEKGYYFVQPAIGKLACGDWGQGRLPDISLIFSEIERLLNLNQDLLGKKVLVTAGPTREYIDPVRFISNPSTGKMGYAISQALLERGAEVTLISGPTFLTPPKNAAFFKVETAEQMLKLVLEFFPKVDILFKTAAVCDYRPTEFSSNKLKKGGTDTTIELKLNPDILSEVGKLKSHQTVIGFAAETENMENFALEKLRNKNLDYIMANNVTLEGAGFASDTNHGVLFTKKGLIINIPIMTKLEFAHRLIDEIKKEEETIE